MTKSVDCLTTCFVCWSQELEAEKQAGKTSLTSWDSQKYAVSFAIYRVKFVQMCNFASSKTYLNLAQLVVPEISKEVWSGFPSLVQYQLGDLVR